MTRQTWRERRARAPKGEPYGPRLVRVWKRWGSTVILSNAALAGWALLSSPEALEAAIGFVPPPWNLVAYAALQVVLRLRSLPREESPDPQPKGPLKAP